MRQIMAQMEHRKALQEAEDATRKTAAAQAASTPEKKEEEEPKPANNSELEEEEVPKCHLHRKVNKACRFCKKHSAFLEKQTASKEKAKQEVLNKIQAESEAAAAKVDHNQRILLPQISQFPHELRVRILSHRIYEVTISDYGLTDCKEKLFESESCEIDTPREDMSFVPSSWIMCLYRMMIIRPSEGEFHTLLKHESIWVRCAAYLIVRVGMNQDRYWELLSAGLMDDTEFKPFPKRDPRAYTMGEYVQKLLSEDRYCDETLPRISMGLRKTLNERLVLYGQFRERYQANLEVLDRYESPGVEVEVCKELDGEWVSAKTLGAKNFSQRCVTMPVKFDDGTEQNVSIGMMITVDPDADQADLTKSRGRSNKELLEKYRQEQKKGAVMGQNQASRKDQHTPLPNTFIGPGKSGKRKKTKEEEEEDEEVNAFQEAKKRRETQEREREISQIMQKYCAAAAPSSKMGSSSAGDVDEPDHMRLG